MMERGGMLVNILAVFFGIGTWLCVNGLWVELPLLVQKLPEAWNLPSYMAIVVQIANIGPLLYTVLNSFFPKIVTENRSIYFVMVIGMAANILLAQFWEKTTVVFGKDHSTGLLVLVFFLASVDCSSRVLYLPFMATLQATYLNAFFIGEGLSGFVPSIFALIQGVGGNPECRNNTDGSGTYAYTPDPLFSVEIFFYLLFAVTLTSAIAFYLLNYYPVVQHALAVQNQSPESHGVLLHSTGTPYYQSTSNGNSPDSVRRMEIAKISTNKDSTDIHSETMNPHGIEEIEYKMSKSLFIYLLCNQALICAMSNGVFPAIQSYSCLPYGNVAYHWTVSLSNMANPTVCFLGFYLPSPTKKSIIAVSVLALIVSAYVMVTAVMSPSPPLVGEISGEVLLVLSWILLVGLYTYVKVSIANILRSNGQKGLFWCGAVTQFGSAVGAITTFFIVNFSDVFESYYPCT